MKLYLIEAPVNNTEFPYWARTWVASQGEASATRARYTSTLSVPRKDIRTTAFEVDTRKEGLLQLLNSVSSTHDAYFGEASDE